MTRREGGLLLRFDIVEEIGRFSVLKHRAEAFNRLSLVFARNGFGKSTLCAILRSVSEGQPNYISARRRLGALKESKVQSSWLVGGTVAFSAGKWNAHGRRVYLFDQDFVIENLHVGENVTRDNKRSLLPVVLGQEGVNLANKIRKLDQEQREVDGQKKQLAEVIRAGCPVVSSNDVLKFCQSEIPDDIDHRIEGAARSVELAKQSVAVQQKAKLKLLQVFPLSSFRSMAQRTLSSVTQDVGDKVRRHVEFHKLGSNADRWLKYGLDHRQGGKCPFCNQSTDEVDLISAYESYFSDAFNSLVSDRDELLESLRTFVDDGLLQRVVEENKSDFSFWSRVCEIERLPEIDCGTVAEGFTALHRLLEKKVSNPLLVVELGDQEALIEAAFNAVDAYNSAVSTANTAIDRAKSDTQGANVGRATEVLNKWKALNAKKVEPISSAVEAYLKAEGRREEITATKKTAQAELTNYSNTTMGRRQVEINELLAEFGANFSVANAKANFKGREPNTEYAIAIGDSVVGVGEKSDTEPSFKTVLSAGDKTTLALAFFITQVRSDPDLQEAIVVFDDPFNSQDMGRQFETTSQIRAIAKAALQTIVFSHDPRFLHLIEKNADNSVTRTYQLLCKDDGQGTITAWSSSDELKGLYVRHAEIIREFASQGALLPGTDNNSVIQAIRPFLEEYLRARFPGRFNDLSMLSGMISEIKEVGPSDPMFDMVDDLFSLNEFTRQNMHGGADAPDPVALRAQAKKVIKIVGQY